MGRRFQKGSNPNPLGAGAHNPVVKVIRRLTQSEVAEVASLVLEKNADKLKEIRDSKDTPALKAWMCSVALKGIEYGDPQRLNALLDRVIGKPKEESSITLISEDIPKFSRAEAAQMLADARKKVSS